MSGNEVPPEKPLNEGAQGVEEVVIDLSNVPLKPLGKREISQLEMALIIGTLYRPEILELIRDPIERSTWVDSLAVAAGAYARMKAGMPVSQIAEELGRSEQTIRGHLNLKTKAGKLVHETYEKLKKGELKLLVPFIKAPAASSEDRVKALEDELSKYKDRVRELESRVSELLGAIKRYEEENRVLKEEMDKLRQGLEDKERELGSCKSENTALRNSIENLVKGLREVADKLQSLLSTVS